MTVVPRRVVHPTGAVIPLGAIAPAISIATIWRLPAVTLPVLVTVTLVFAAAMAALFFVAEIRVGFGTDHHLIGGDTSNTAASQTAKSLATAPEGTGKENGPIVLLKSPIEVAAGRPSRTRDRGRWP